MAITTNVLPVPKTTTKLPEDQTKVAEQTSQITPQTGSQVPQTTRRQSAVGLRSTLERQGYKVDWDEANRNVLVNGQVIDTTGMQNIRGKYRATPDQIRAITQGLTPQQESIARVNEPLPTGALRDEAQARGYVASYNEPTNMVTVRDPDTGRNIMFESGKGQEYGMGGLVDGYNIVVDRDKFEASLAPQHRDVGLSFKDAFDQATQMASSIGVDFDTTETQNKVNALTDNITSGIQDYMEQMNEKISQIMNQEDVDTQAMVISYLNRTMNMYDQMQQQLEEERENGMDDPGLQASLAMMKDEYGFMREQMLSNLRARGMDSGSQLARAEARLGKGYMNARQQMIGNFMSQLNSRVSQGIMQLMGQRAATMTQFAGMDIQQSGQLAQNRLTRMLGILDALGGMTELQGKIGDIQMQGLSAVEGLKRGERQDILGLTKDIYSQTKEQERFDVANERAERESYQQLLRWMTDAGISQKQAEEVMAMRKAELSLAQQESKDRLGIQRDQLALQRDQLAESVRSNKASELLREESNNIQRLAIKAKEDGELSRYEELRNTAMELEIRGGAIFEGTNKFNTELKNSPAGTKDTYDDYIKSGNLQKMQKAYEHLSKFKTYYDPLDNTTKNIPDVIILLDNIKAEIDRKEKKASEPGIMDWIRGLLPSDDIQSYAPTDTGSGTSFYELPY